MAKRIRLIDIAERLNITKVSVSKALRDHKDISEETKDLVKQVSAEMGYSPNLLARSLSSRRSNTLGVVVPKIAHTFFASVIDAIQEEATRKGYGILLAVSNENAELERQHIERLLAMQVDGLLVSISKQEPKHDVYRRVRDMKVPLVFFDRRISGSGFSSVTVDDRGGAYQAVTRLISQGYRKIAHVAGTSKTEIGRERRTGYEQALHDHGIPLYEPWILEGGFDEGHGYTAFQQILESDPLPEAVFAVSFPVGLGVWGAIRQHRPELADTIKLITFGTGELNELLMYPYLCVCQPTRKLGRRALEILLDAIERDEPPEPRHIIVHTELVTPERTLAQLEFNGANALS